ncbi:MAG: hypothetical protein NVS3B12_28660 [Acidimicrobiales bacterium]
MARGPQSDRRLVARRLGASTPIAQAVNDHLAALGVRGLSENTVVYRAQVLSHLVVWLAERGVTHPGEVTKPVLERYQRHLFHYRKADGAPLSFRTQGNYLVAIKGLFRWLARTNRILFNPASELELPRAERRLPRTVLSVAEVEAVMATPELGDPLGLRDRTLMEVLYSTGIRRAELARLAVTDIDAERGILAVRQGKGRKDRLVPIGERALTWVDRYLIEVRPNLVVPPDEGMLLLTVEGNPLTPNYLTWLVGSYIGGAGIAKTGSCHTFRHTMATLMLDGGADIRHIQEMLGHANLATTERYTHVAIARLKEVHDACHPGATNTRHRRPVPEPSSSPTERSDGGSVLPPPSVPPHMAPPHVDRPDTVAPLRAVADDTAPPDTNQHVSAADELLAALDTEAAEEAGEDHDQLQEPGVRGEP